MKTTTPAATAADVCYTPTAHASRAADILAEYLAAAVWPPARTLIIEPSAGAGALRDAVLERLPSAPFLAFDVAPAAPKIKRADFLNDKATDALIARARADHDATHTAVIMNPPFGRSAGLAVQHLARALRCAQLVVAILPRTANQPRFQQHTKLPHGARLLSSELLDPSDTYARAGTPVCVRCCVQVWVRPSRAHWFAGYSDRRCRTAAPTPASLGLEVKTVKRTPSGLLRPRRHGLTLLAHGFENAFREKTARGIVQHAVWVAGGTTAAQWTGSPRALAALRAIDWTAIADARSTIHSWSVSRETVCRAVAEYLAQHPRRTRRRSVRRAALPRSTRPLAHSRRRRIGESTTTEAAL